MSTSLTTLLCGFGGVLLLVVFGGIAIFSGIKNKRKAESSKSWPKAIGEITRNYVQENTDTDEEGYTTHTYTPRLEYRYQVGNQTYSSSRISFGATTSYGRRKKAEEKIAQFPVGVRIAVYYNPQKPDEATLQQSAKGTVTGIVIGAILVVVGLCVVMPAILYAFISNM